MKGVNEMEPGKRLIDLEQVSESIIWGIVNDPHRKGDISDRIIEYLNELPVIQEYDVDEIVEKMTCLSNYDGFIKLEDAVELIRDINK